MTVAAAALVLGLMYAFLTGEPDPRTARIAELEALASQGNVELDPLPGSDDSAPLPPDTGGDWHEPDDEPGGETTTGAPDGTVTLEHVDGGSAHVDTDALEAARTGARAMFTGDFTGVPLAADAPTITRTFADPQVDEPQVLTSVAGFIQFSFPVDPDGDGPQQRRSVVISVSQNSDGTWVVAP